MGETQVPHLTGKAKTGQALKAQLKVRTIHHSSLSPKSLRGKSHRLPHTKWCPPERQPQDLTLFETRGLQARSFCSMVGPKSNRTGTLRRGEDTRIRETQE